MPHPLIQNCSQLTSNPPSKSRSPLMCARFSLSMTSWMYAYIFKNTQ